MSNLTLGAVIGLLLGLAWCYYKQIRAVYDNKDLLSSGSNLYDSASNFYSQLRKL